MMEPNFTARTDCRAARILMEAFPAIATFDAVGLTAEQIHYYLGESAGVAYFQLQALRNAGPAIAA
ncbi:MULTISPECIES: hypothetical protein [Arthrobacter]|uniref:Uncharacterized protein n=1 Tax=Arthrobacter terricola TaxID=2547396 RepID=A0A4R5KAJ3_9MICC|nr:MULTISPECIES: hypothetical protein [Arthrobacter]MBT8163207.1 hypothetical protein [Arthrobacter sp. GN70]TDF91535.1 hypothetical protein E1809_20630 [Arthrobacter terricola]